MISFTRALIAIVLSSAACGASATVERTMPVSNLQVYRTIAVRVRNNTFATQGLTVALEGGVIDKLRRACRFDQVERESGQPADIVLDLNITATGRGGGGLIVNTSSATVDALLVLTDTQDRQLLGTAKIRGKSGGAIVNNSVPELEAVEEIAKSVATLLEKSGCGGPRIARAPDPPLPSSGSGSGTGSGSDTGAGSAAPPAEDARLPEADAINEQGKKALYAADLAEALRLFKRAHAVSPNARFAYNACVVQLQLEQWAEALASCKQARSLSPAPALAAKIDSRIAQLEQRK